MRTILLEEQASEGKEGISCAVRKTAKEGNESFVCSRDGARLAGGGGRSGRERGGRDAFLGVVVVVVVGGRGDAGKRLDRICMRMYEYVVGMHSRWKTRMDDVGVRLLRL